MATDALKYLEKITGGRLTLRECLWSIRTCDELTQVEFAKKLHISLQCLRDIEHGRRMVSPKQAREFAEILEYSAEHFESLAVRDAVFLDSRHLEVA